jgi:hypothetical protein
MDVCTMEMTVTSGTRLLGRHGRWGAGLGWWDFFVSCWEHIVVESSFTCVPTITTSRDLILVQYFVKWYCSTFLLLFGN